LRAPGSNERFSDDPANCEGTEWIENLSAKIDIMLIIKGPICGGGGNIEVDRGAWPEGSTPRREYGNKSIQYL
jgi:hypothetical protein